MALTSYLLVAVLAESVKQHYLLSNFTAVSFGAKRMTL